MNCLGMNVDLCWKEKLLGTAVLEVSYTLVGSTCRKTTRFSWWGSKNVPHMAPGRRGRIMIVSHKWSLLGIFHIDVSITLHRENFARDLSLPGKDHSSDCSPFYPSWLTKGKTKQKPTMNKAQGFKVRDRACCSQRRKLGLEGGKSYSTEEKDLWRSQFQRMSPLNDWDMNRRL